MSANKTRLLHPRFSGSTLLFGGTHRRARRRGGSRRDARSPSRRSLPDVTSVPASAAVCAYVSIEVISMNNANLLVIYSTVNGQAERIARRIAEAAQDSGVEAVVKDVRQASGADLESPGSVIVVASVRFGKHSRPVTR